MEVKPYEEMKEQILERLLRSETFLPFGLELLKRNILFTDKVPKGVPAATDFKRIYINPENDFFKHSSVNHICILLFAFLHEIGHIIFCHDKRSQGKDKHLWWYACDFMLNLFLYNIEKELNGWENQSNLLVMRMSSYTDKILFSEKFSNMLEEEIYDYLQQNGNYSKEEKEESYKDFLDSIGASSDGIDEESKIKITKVDLDFDNHHEKKVFIEFPDSEEVQSDNEELDLNLTKCMFETRIMQRGFQNIKFEGFLKKIFNVKIPWDAILLDSIMIELQKSSDISYGKPRMSWLINSHLPYMPNYTEEENFGTVVFLIDESASIMNDDIAKAVSVIQQSDSYYKNVFVIKHDTLVKWSKLYEEINDEDIAELLIRKHLGGTSHKDAFQKVIDFSNKSDTYISLVISITDLFSDIKQAQSILPMSIPRLYLRSNKEYTNVKDIVGKVITIQ